MSTFMWHFNRFDIRYGLVAIDQRAGLLPHVEVNKFQILLEINGMLEKCHFHVKPLMYGNNNGKYE